MAKLSLFIDRIHKIHPQDEWARKEHMVTGRVRGPAGKSYFLSSYILRLSTRLAHYKEREWSPDVQI